MVRSGVIFLQFHIMYNSRA